MASRKKVDSKLDRALKDPLRAYATGNERFFSFFTDDARIYPVDSQQPIVGRKAFAARFGPQLTAAKRKVEKLHTDIQATAEQAIIAQTLSITTNGVTTPVRQSVVWDKQSDGSWKISHLHTAQAGHPIVSPGKLPGNVNAVTVLNEKIATVAAVLGVAQ
jgi:ketosteroid isomerase-like protein